MNPHLPISPHLPIFPYFLLPTPVSVSSTTLKTANTTDLLRFTPIPTAVNFRKLDTGKATKRAQEKNIHGFWP